MSKFCKEIWIFDALEDNIQDRGPMNILISDGAHAEISKKATDSLQSLSLVHIRLNPIINTKILAKIEIESQTMSA